MTQTMIEQLDAIEYSHLLAFGDGPERTRLLDDRYTDVYDAFDLLSQDDSDELEWISTLDSTTFPGMTFGYIAAPCMSTVVS